MLPDQPADQGLQRAVLRLRHRPFGGYTANNRGERFIECDYWSRQMMLEFWRELQGGNGPVFLKMDHLREETILRDRDHPALERAALARALHERRGTNYRRRP